MNGELPYWKSPVGISSNKYSIKHLELEGKKEFRVTS
jgi:hypothetical protein